jgi:hypothetical protein
MMAALYHLLDFFGAYVLSRNIPNEADLIDQLFTPVRNVWLVFFSDSPSAVIFVTRPSVSSGQRSRMLSYAQGVRPVSSRKTCQELFCVLSRPFLVEPFVRNSTENPKKFCGGLSAKVPELCGTFQLKVWADFAGLSRTSNNGGYYELWSGCSAEVPAQ